MGIYKKMIKNFFLVLLTSFFIIASMVHCGGGSPGPNIPAPVGELMSISSPDLEGLVKVTGMNGAVFPQATVVVTNKSKHEGDSLIKDLNKAGDLRQESITTQAATVADINGSFEVYVRADIKEEVAVVQILEGEQSDETELIVPDNTLSLRSSLSHLSVNPYDNLAVMIGNDDQNGLVYMLKYSPVIPLYSHQEPTIKLDQSNQLSKVAVHPFKSIALAISEKDNLLIYFSLNEGASSESFSVNSPLSITIQPDVELAALGLQGKSSIQLYDTLNHSLSCEVTINNSLGDSEHVQTKFVDIQLDNQENIKFVAASEFDDGSVILSKISFSSCENPIAGMTQVLLPQGIELSGMASFDFGNKALVSDGNSNRVYLVDLVNLKLIPIIVGETPHEIIIDELYNSAYVANVGDNSVSFIDLLTREVKTKEHIGLMPSTLGLFYNLEEAAVFSSFDNSVVFIDLDF